ncbi:glycosyltransferase [Flavobacterium sp.]|jgi:glycosyltransferase involved in cell wall biosynthesis|uniref:glycosyltransferase n=1 Tax=Flavobacterium sp. TaxID=239 RepID=UPI0037BF7859
MNLLIISTSDIGGAANACFRLHNALLDEKINSKVIVSKKQKNYRNTFLFKNNIINTFILKTISFLKYKIKLRKRSKELELFSFPDSNFDITKSELYKDATIINLHWVARFLDFNFFKKNKKPVIWTLHDMNPFTGGEHYDEEYLGIDEFGFPIKRILSKSEKKLFKKIISYKKKCIDKIENLTIVAPSEWLANEARKSKVFGSKPIYCIPYGLDSEIFSPKDRQKSRDLLKIPQDKKVLLFVADSILNSRKGFIYLKKALEQIEDPNVILCAIGKNQINFKSTNNIIELGSINNDELLSHVYSSADVFIIPSLMDNLPNTVLESLFCSTPVIGFPIGGIPEMIQDGVNGYLTEDVSVQSLTKTIQNFLDNPNFFDKKQIRENAVNKYDQTIQAKKYIELFKKIAKKNDT